MRNSIIYYLSNKNNPPTPPFSKGGKGGLLGEKGLTLIEVMVAIVVLAIGLIGVALMQYMAVAGNSFGREMQIATELGQELLEKVKSNPVRNTLGNVNNIFQTGSHPTAADIAVDATLQNPVGSGEPNYDPVTRAGGINFTRVWWVVDTCRNINVALNPNDPCNTGSAVTCPDAMTNMRAVAVRVCWVDKNGGNHSVTLNGVKWDETATP